MKRTKQGLRWTVTAAAAEFPISRESLSQKLKRNGTKPDAKGTFSTMEVCDAVFGGMEAERLRKTREEADKLAIHNDKERGQLLPRDIVFGQWSARCSYMKTHVLNLAAKCRARFGPEVGEWVDREARVALEEIAKPVKYTPEGDEED